MGRGRAVALAASRDVLDLYRQWEWMVTVHSLRAPTYVREDVEQAARLGLWRAARTWDQEKGSNFYGWAKKCIRWETSDEMRRLDHLPRRDRDYLSGYDRWSMDYSRHNHREPTHQESLAAGWDRDRISRLTREKTSTEKLVEDPPAPDDTCEQAVSNIMSNRLQDALAGLPFREWQAASLRWLEDWPPAKIAEYMGVSEAQVYYRIRVARERLLTALEGEDYV